jgi:hypothetical protein
MDEPESTNPAGIFNPGALHNLINLSISLSFPTYPPIGLHPHLLFDLFELLHRTTLFAVIESMFRESLDCS